LDTFDAEEGEAEEEGAAVAPALFSGERGGAAECCEAEEELIREDGGMEGSVEGNSDANPKPPPPDSVLSRRRGAARPAEGVRPNAR
jgi:hypothetical protein